MKAMNFEDKIQLISVVENYKFSRFTYIKISFKPVPLEQV